jgi:hypothetical protein
MIKPIPNRKNDKIAISISFSKIAIYPKRMNPNPTFATGCQDRFCSGLK